MAAHALVCKFLCSCCAVGAGRTKQEAVGKPKPPAKNMSPHLSVPPMLPQPSHSCFWLWVTNTSSTSFLCADFMVAADVLFAGSYSVSSSDLVTNGMKDVDGYLCQDVLLVPRCVPGGSARGWSVWDRRSEEADRVTPSAEEETLLQSISCNVLEQFWLRDFWLHWISKLFRDLGQTSKTGWWICAVGANLGCCLFQK